MAVSAVSNTVFETYKSLEALPGRFKALKKTKWHVKQEQKRHGKNSRVFKAISGFSRRIPENSPAVAFKCFFRAC